MYKYGSNHFNCLNVACTSCFDNICIFTASTNSVAKTDKNHAVTIASMLDSKSIFYQVTLSVPVLIALSLINKNV